MTTRILDLPLLTFPMTVGNNEDWLDSWAYVDDSNVAIPLTGITLNFMVRRTASDALVFVIASTGATLNGLAVNGAVLSGGTANNVIGLSIPQSTMQRISPGAYVFEAQATADGAFRRIATGALTVDQGIVR